MARWRFASGKKILTAETSRSLTWICSQVLVEMALLTSSMDLAFLSVLFLVPGGYTTYHLLLLRVLVSESQYGSCKAMMSAKRGDTVFKRAWVALRELLIFCCQMRKFCLAVEANVVYRS